MPSPEPIWNSRDRRPEYPPGGRETNCFASAVAGWQSRVREHVGFLSSFLREPRSVGALAPSSRFLARRVVSFCPLASASTVIELGPGTGAFTGLIREGLNPATTFFALELNADHVRALRRKFPGVQVYHDSAERMADYLAFHGKRHANCVISGLPWALLSQEQQTRLLTTIHESLAPGGVFVAFAYAHARWMARARDFRDSMQARFARVETSPVVWGNLPPAFVYRCTR